MPKPQDYTVGWICAIVTEYVAAQVFLDEEHEGPEFLSPNDNNSYTLGKIGKHNVVIAVLPHGEYGISSAASVARDLLHSFPNVRIGLMVGIGGGAPSRKHDIRLGDVVVSASGNGKGGVFQYDFGKATQNQDFQETGFLNQPPQILRAAVSELMAWYKRKGNQIDTSINNILMETPKLKREFGRPDSSTDRLYQPGVLHPQSDESSCETACGNDPSTLVMRPERADYEDNPSIHYGLIASANRLMKDALFRDALAKKNDVLCFEMEAAGLMNHFPCLVIRGICDYSDTHKNKEWQGYAAMTAAVYAKDLLYKIAPNKVEKEERLIELVQSVSKQMELVHQVATEIINTTKFMQGDNHLNKIRNWLAPPDPSTNLNLARSLHHPGTDLDPNNSKVLYFFFNFNDVEKRSLEKAIRSLIFQLYFKHTILRSEVDAIYSSLGDGTRQPDVPSLDKLLRHMLTKAEEIYIVLDALDESERHVGSYSSNRLLDWIKGIQDESPNIHMLVTSRPEQDIITSFKGWAHTDKIIRLQGDLVSDDITAYTKARASEMPRWKKRPDIQTEIETTLLEKADGMFRWVSCQFDTLEQCLDPPSVRRELQILPETLDATYEQILRRINPRQLGTAKRLLQFLTYSERPLKLEEAVDLIAVDPSSQPAFAPENRMPIPEEIIQYCSSLVTLTYKSGEYGNALQAASTWGHLDIAQMLIQKGANINAQGGKYGNALHAALEEGHLDIAQMLIQKGADINAQGGKYGNALQAALEEGHLYIAQILIQKGADIHAQGGEYGNALQATSAQGHLDIAQMLIQKGMERKHRLSDHK
uniref:Nephrocystin 3-like N-terminal domain-containing protein n=1 Tax=Bionectria ochroleuca TaxID=29856 RepID=A0A8H7TTB6_BIOOC